MNTVIYFIALDLSGNKYATILAAPAFGSVSTGSKLDIINLHIAGAIDFLTQSERAPVRLRAMTT